MQSRGLLTTSGLGQLCQLEKSIIAGNRLEGDIRVPLALSGLTMSATVPCAGEAIGVELLGLL